MELDPINGWGQKRVYYVHTKEQKAERLPSDNDDAEDDDDDDEPSQAMMAHHPHKTALGCVLDDGGWADKRGKLNESEKRFDRLSTRFIARRIDTIIGRRRVRWRRFSRYAFFMFSQGYRCGKSAQNGFFLRLTPIPKIVLLCVCVCRYFSRCRRPLSALVA